MGEADLQSLAECRMHCDHRQLPKHFRDVAPEPPAALPPLPLQAIADYPQPSSQKPLLATPLTRKILKSPRNIFGIFRQYNVTRFPDHDPEGHLTPDDLNISPSFTPSAQSYSPYPNLSLFLLGEWYWNGGKKEVTVKLSKSSQDSWAPRVSSRRCCRKKLVTH